MAPPAASRSSTRPARAGTSAGIRPFRTTAASRCGRSILSAIARERAVQRRLVVRRLRGDVLAEEPDLEPAEAAQGAETVAGGRAEAAAAAQSGFSPMSAAFSLNTWPATTKRTGVRRTARERLSRRRVASFVDRPPTLTPSTWTPRASVSGDPAYTIESAIASSTNRSTAASEIRLMRRTRACRRRRM